MQNTELVSRIFDEIQERQREFENSVSAQTVRQHFEEMQQRTDSATSRVAKMAKHFNDQRLDLRAWRIR